MGTRDRGRTLKPHPASELFDPLEGESFEALKRDIKEHGQIVPILTFDGKVLDGRARMRACEELGIEPRLEEVPAGKDPVAVSFAANRLRRQLSLVQAALSTRKALEMRGWKPEAPQTKGGRPSMNGKPRNQSAVSVRTFAKEVGVDEKTIRNHLHVAESFAALPPKIQEAVAGNQVTLSQALAVHAEAVKQEPDGFSPEERAKVEAVNTRYRKMNADYGKFSRWMKGQTDGLSFWLAYVKKTKIGSEFVGDFRRMIKEQIRNLREMGRIIR